MSVLHLDAIDDFVESVLKNYKEGSWQDISQPLQKYHFADRIFNKHKKNEAAGPELEFKLQIASEDNFKLTGLYASDTSERINVLTHGTVQWSQNTTNYTYDLGEQVFSQGARKIIEYFNVQEKMLMDSYFRGMENLVFGPGPSSPTQNPRPPYGILWWLQKNATEGFNGGIPSGFTDVAGINPTTYPNWKNRTFSYTQWTRDDAIEKIINSMDLCEFTPPVPYQQLANSKPQWELLTTHSRLALSRKLLQAGNDNIGDDLAAHSGVVYIRGIPMLWIPAWTKSSSTIAQTDGPIVGINWSTFEYVFREGWSMVKRKPYQDKDKHNVRWRVMDDAGQIVCYDRRANFIGYSTVTVTETA